MKKCMVLLFFFALQTYAMAGSNNWAQDPKIKGIRQIVNNVDVKIKNGPVVTKTRSFCYDNPNFTEHIIIETNDGRPLKYSRSGGSDDHVVNETSYYDQNGKLRFVYRVTNHINYGRKENRIYLDPSEKIIWQTGDPIVSVKEQNLVLDATKEFSHAQEGNGKEIPAGKDEKSYCQ